MPSICILSTVHSPTNTRVFHKEARAANSNYDVSYIVHNPPKDLDTEITFYSLGTAETRFKRWTHLLQAYRMAHSIDADIYHFHDPELLPVGILLKATTDGSVIYDAHEDYGFNALKYREWIPRMIRPWVAKAFPQIQSMLANRLDAVITTTESIAEQFRELGHQRVEVIHNFPKTEAISIGDPPVCSTHDVTLVYVGSFEHIHGLMPMLRLVQELHCRDIDVELWMLGSFGEERNKQHATEFIDHHELNDVIRFFGRIPYEDIFAYLHEADIGLCLVDQKRCEHALPTKIFEYLYAETPVVATDARSIRPYISDDVGRLVSQTSSQEQADAVLELVSDRERLSSMGKHGRHLVEQEYNWEQEAKKLLALYESLR
ncbi:glycosyltransferase [Haloplanus rubicundus]|uniref:Glycosyltransferase n=1 Tax=Haloplanus rubicundus TaxID=1547898 RepID=A0A345E274_9EURY|nr:glycosyltransferase family 4 protein [Haloplanus rubicundus]AXG06296.1 glycosyltransferase [Haloplanus rubicundus]